MAGQNLTEEMQLDIAAKGRADGATTWGAKSTTIPRGVPGNLADNATIDRLGIPPMLRPMLKSLLVATLAATVTAIPAHADEGPAGDNPKDNYIYVLHSEGINASSDSGAVELGLALCGRVATGVKPRTLMAGVADFAPTLTSYQAEAVVDSAVTWLCPQYIRRYLANR